MTTVAMDAEGLIAWDSQVTVSNGARVPYDFDKVWIADKRLYAFAGEIICLDAAIAWHRAGAKRDRVPRGEWSLLVVTTRSAAIFAHDAPWRTAVTGYFAMGSGENYALGALAAGANAYQAVQIAKKFDTGTGGTINSIHRSKIK